jgi:hypothetical protein
MKTTRSLSVFALAIAGFLLCAPLSALCTGNCGGTEQCPECVFSAFFSYICIGSQCRWCAVWECQTAAPPTAADELAQWLQPADVASAGTCTALLPPETSRADLQPRVVRLEARL